MRRPANLMLASTRAAWGLALLTVPGPLVRWAGGDDTKRARAVGRVLGARHLVQAGLVAAGWPPAVWPLGPAADVAHAATAAGLAVVDRRWRRVGMIDATVATSFAASPLLVRR
ncbi:MAG TPA: hypothetical protein VKU91_07060 [Acidimicrobiales bacterium]|nr:hypothetical protein [Acidimicrobiales bacterium]